MSISGTENGWDIDDGQWASLDEEPFSTVTVTNSNKNSMIKILRQCRLI